MLRKSRAAGLGTLMVILVGAVFLSAGLLLAQQAPSLIFHNGKVVTVDDTFSIAQAIAVTGQRITAVGSNADVMKLAGPGTQVIDLKGRTVVPGLIDTHLHTHNIMEGAYRSQMAPDKANRLPIDWRAVRTKNDVIVQIQATMDKYKFEPGRWLYFVNEGLNSGTPEQQVEKRNLLYNEMTRWDLDKATPNNPIIMDIGTPDTSGNFSNSKSIDYLWEKYGDFITKYGRFWVDASGRPDGHLEPPANRLLFPMKNNRAPEVLAPVYKKGLEELAAEGMTAFSSRFPEDTVAAYRLLESQGALTARVAYGLETFAHILDPKVEMKQWASKMGAGSDKVWISSMGGEAIDGAGARNCVSAPRLSAYDAVDSWWPRGACNTDSEYQGAAGRAQRTTGNYFREWVVQSGLNGVRFANTHVGGDRSIKLMLGMINQIVDEAGPNAVKDWAFDHCTFVDPADLKEVARLKLTFSCAPSFIVSPSALRSYGQKVADTWLVPLKSMLDAGIKVAYEGDRDRYIWSELQLMVTRKDNEGKIWSPQERVNRNEVLKMATRNAADYVLRGDQLGTLEAGKLADFVVLDRDYMTIPEDDIGKIEPQITVFDGEIVFVHSKFAQEYNLRPAGATVGTYEELKGRRPSAPQVGTGGGAG